MQKCFAYIQGVTVEGDDQGCWIVVGVEMAGGRWQGHTAMFMAELEHLPSLMNMLGVYTLVGLVGQIVRIETADGQSVAAMAGPADEPWIPWINAGHVAPAGNGNELRQ